jgi:2-(acetamidomethylene)succinate hydrolase
MHEEFFNLPATQIFAVSAGSGPTLICLHGITANAFVFEPILRLLAGRFRFFSIDQRGHGRSGTPEGYGAADFAGDVAALVERLGTGPAILLGHSLGARNALVAANRRPDLVRGVVAVDFTPFIENSVMDELDLRVRGGDRNFAGLADVEAYLGSRYPLLPPDAIARRAKYGYRAGGDGYRPLARAAAMAATAAGLRESLEADLAALRCRTILVRGASSKLVSADAWRRTKALRPDLEAFEIAAADHYVPEEQPAAIAALVEKIGADWSPPLPIRKSSTQGPT